MTLTHMKSLFPKILLITDFHQPTNQPPPGITQMTGDTIR